MVAQNKPHIVVVMDCCNSGSGTRNTDDTVERQTKAFDRPRPLDSYILPRKLNRERAALSADPMEVLTIPEGRHVQLAAAHSSQTAKETSLNGQRRGVFTYSLLKVLQNSTGQLAYSDLVRRVRTMISNKVKDQDPQIFATNSDDINAFFLDGAVRPKPEYYTLSFDNKLGWTINAGAVHGIQAAPQRNESTILNLFAGDASDEDLKDAGKSTGKAFVTKVLSNVSVVETEPPLDPEKGYKAIVTSIPVEPLRIAITGDEAGVLPAKDALNFRPETGGKSLYLKEVGHVLDSEYILKAKNNEYMIVRHADDQERPLVEQIPGYSQESAQKAIGNLEHIARWENTMELSNPSSNLPSESIRIQVFTQTGGGGEVEASADGKNIVLTYNQEDGAESRPRFRVKLINSGFKRLYCCLLYMSSQFEVNPGLIPQGGEWLEPGEELWAINGRSFTASVDDAWVPIRGKLNPVTGLKETELKENFKLVFGTTQIDGNLFRQEKMGIPHSAHRSAGAMNSLEKMLGKVQTRDLLFDAPSAGPIDDWNTSEISVTIVRSDSTVV
jgi:hypothetical protein